MKVIFKGKVTEVSDGYARNYLLPKGLALPATSENIKKIENTVREQQKEKQEQDRKYLRIFSETNGKIITLGVKAGEGDRLFGSVTKDAVAQALKIDKNYIQIAEPVKRLGTYSVSLKVGTHKGTVTLKVTKIDEGGNK